MRKVIDFILYTLLLILGLYQLYLGNDTEMLICFIIATCFSLYKDNLDLREQLDELNSKCDILSDSMDISDKTLDILERRIDILNNNFDTLSNSNDLVIKLMDKLSKYFKDDCEKRGDE